VVTMFPVPGNQRVSSGSVVPGTIVPGDPGLFHEEIR